MFQIYKYFKCFNDCINDKYNLNKITDIALSKTKQTFIRKIKIVIFKYFRVRYKKIYEKLTDIEYESFINSVNTSANKNQIALNTYFMYLIFTFISITNITSESFFKNDNISFFILNISIDIDSFTYYTPFIIFTVQLFILENLLSHYSKVMTFVNYKKHNKDIDFNLLLLNPFSFNNKALYNFKHNKSTYFTLVIMILILLVLPIMILLFLYQYTLNSDIIFMSIIAMTLLNISFLYRANKKSLPIIFYIIVIVVSIMYLLNTYNNYSKNLNDITFKDLTPLSEKVLLEFDDEKDINSLNIKYAKGIRIENRDISKFAFIETKIANSTFNDSIFTDFKYEDTKLIGNKYINSHFINHTFYQTDIISSNFKSKYLDTYTPYKKNSLKLKMNNINFNGTNIKDSLFKSVLFTDVEFSNGNISNSIFIRNTYNNFKVNNSNIFNSLFYYGKFGINDKELNNRITEFKEKKSYKKELNERKGQDKKDFIEFTNEVKKEEIFDSVNLKGTIFNNIIFENSIFHNTDFNDAIFLNTKFMNCTFRYSSQYFKTKKPHFLSEVELLGETKIMVDNKILNKDIVSSFSAKSEFIKIDKERKKSVCDNIKSKAIELKLHDASKEIQSYIDSHCNN